ncbi:hypothetical protein DKX38_022252 [Salix brachista]|uniref:F-box/LRR-repeat protein 15-like leucin rich repeat domain-containing protein n=1 Tax=Salix brachista TaxID=2182728 RepID=A0A5N5K3U8_9ROSI|nr:hypothetical protein DKX38_022252 [Salix brachista]
MKTNKKTTSNCNPFDFLTEEIIFTILDYLNDDPFSKKSFSLTCKALYSIESHHRKTLKPLRAELLSRTLHRDWISMGFLESLFTLLLVLESQPHLGHLPYLSSCHPYHLPLTQDGGWDVSCKLKSEDNEGEVGKISPVAGESSSVGDITCVSMDMSCVSKGDATDSSSFVGVSMVVEDGDSGSMGVLCLGESTTSWSPSLSLQLSSLSLAIDSRWWMGCMLCLIALCSINLSRSRFFTNIGLSSLVSSCFNLVEIDLSNGVELNDLAAAAIAEAKNLEKLWLSRCKLITDMGIGCVAVGCRKLRLICLKWCLKVSDLGLQLLALKCKEIRSLDLSYLQITEKCLPSILQLQHEDLVLEGCLGIDDNALSTLQQSCKSLKTLNMSNCHNHSHVGLSSLINGVENLRELTLAYGPAITEDLAKCLHTFSGLRSVKFDGCLVKCSGVRAIGRWPRSLKELSFSKCSGVEDDSLSFLVRAHKELTKLDITCCRKITYDSVDSITSSCRSLTSVRMESCSLVPKEAFVLFGQRCELIEELDVTDSKIDDEGLKSISRCSKLSSLKLGICLNITDDGLKHIGSRCSKLKELDLYRFCLNFQCHWEWEYRIFGLKSSHLFLC